MRWMKRRDWLFDDFFRDFEDEFRGIEEEIIRILDEADVLSEDKNNSKQVIYGFSVEVGPEGEPKIVKFDNILNNKDEVSSTDEREPLIDIIELGKKIKVVAELPGLEKEDIFLDLTENMLEINVNTTSRKYNKKLVLPNRVKPNVSKAVYKNGVLEVTLTQLKEKNNGSFRINIE